MICGCKKNSNTVSACNRHLRHTPLNMSWKRCWIFTFVFFCSINIISASHKLNFRYYAEQLTVPLVDSIKHGGEDMMREHDCHWVIAHIFFMYALTEVDVREEISLYELSAENISFTGDCNCRLLWGESHVAATTVLVLETWNMVVSY